MTEDSDRSKDEAYHYIGSVEAARLHECQTCGAVVTEGKGRDLHDAWHEGLAHSIGMASW